MTPRPDALIAHLETATEENRIEVYTDGVRTLLAYIRHLEAAGSAQGCEALDTAVEEALGEALEWGRQFGEDYGDKVTSDEAWRLWAGLEGWQRKIREIAAVPPSPAPAALRIIEEKDLEQRIAKLRAESPLINSLMVHHDNDFDKMIEDFAERNPQLEAQALARMGARKVTVYVEADSEPEGTPSETPEKGGQP